MGLLDANDWVGKIFIGGKRVDGGGGSAPVVEPATGAEMSRQGLASPRDVLDAAASAGAAQREWAALPHTGRAAVLRKGR